MTLQEMLNNGDRFACVNGIQLVEVREGYARAEMTVKEEHLNMGGVCQGGAIFTLADLAFAAVCNSGGQLTFGVNNTIAFLQSARLGDKLTAEAVETCNHPKMPYCEIKVCNQDKILIAAITGQAYRKKTEFSFDSLM